MVKISKPHNYEIIPHIKNNLKITIGKYIYYIYVYIYTPTHTHIYRHFSQSHVLGNCIMNLMKPEAPTDPSRVSY